MIFTLKPEDHSEADLLRLEEMVGRRQEIETFQKLVQADGVHLLVVSGEGGIGKTRLLQYLVKFALPYEQDKYLVAQDYIDLIHVATHDRERFARLLAKSFLTWDQLFPKFKQKLSILDGFRAAGKAKEAAHMQKETLQCLCDELANISKTKHLVFVLDTGERWIYNLNTGTQKADAWEWLLCLLKGMQNATIILAGRQAVEMLAQDAEKQKINVVRLSLLPFSEEETQKYISKVLEMQGRIEFVAGEYTALHTLSQGMPIMLSLVLENYLSSTNIRRMRELVELAKEYQKAKKYRREQLLEKFEGEIIRSLMEDPQMQEILVALGRAPKGVNASLLASMLQIDPRQANNLMKEAKRYVFIKEYQYLREYETVDVEPRLFLHDRLYEMLRKHVFNLPKDNIAKNKTFEILDTYYTQETQKLSRILAESYEQISKGISAAPYNRERFAYIETYRSQLFSEWVYYSLHYQPEKGLKGLVRFTQEAIHTYSPETVVLLEIELSGYLAGVDRLSYPIPDRDLTYFLQFLLELQPSFRAHTIRADHVLDMIQNLRRKVKEFKVESSNSYHAMLATLYSLEGTVYLSKRKPIEEHFTAALDEIKAITNPTKWLDWYNDYLRGTIYYGYGFNHRIYGRYKEATENYHNALQLWHKTKFETPEATTRNDLGFALAEQGKFFEAALLVTRALEMRRKLGLGFSIGLSKNTMARIYLFQENYTAANDYAQQAYALFRALANRYGEGLSLIAMAEINRRMTSDLRFPSSPKDKYDLLQRALDYANPAVDIFSEELKEPSRQVEALIEKGSVLRDQVRYYETLSQYARINVDRCIKESRIAYNEAIKIATDRKITYRVLDALVNMAWLEYYVGHQDSKDFTRIESSINTALKAFEDSNYTWENALKPEEVLKQQDLFSYDWTRLGKLYMLQGNLELVKFKLDEDESHLFETARSYLRALKFDHILGDDYRDIRQAKNGISYELERLNVATQQKFTQKVVLAEDDPDKGRSLLRDFMHNTGVWID